MISRLAAVEEEVVVEVVVATSEADTVEAVVTATVEGTTSLST